MLKIRLCKPLLYLYLSSLIVVETYIHYNTTYDKHRSFAQQRDYGSKLELFRSSVITAQKKRGLVKVNNDDQRLLKEQPPHRNMSGDVRGYKKSTANPGIDDIYCNATSYNKNNNDKLSISQMIKAEYKKQDVLNDQSERNQLFGSAYDREESVPIGPKDQEEIETRLLELVTSYKQVVTSANEIILGDIHNLGETGKIAERNAAKLSHERDRLGKYTVKHKSNTWFRIYTVLGITVVFVWMVLLIRFIPI